jgi:hypothetical protein
MCWKFGKNRIQVYIFFLPIHKIINCVVWHLDADWLKATDNVPRVWLNLPVYLYIYVGNRFLKATRHLGRLWYIANIPLRVRTAVSRGILAIYHKPLGTLLLLETGHQSNYNSKKNGGHTAKSAVRVQTTQLIIGQYTTPPQALLLKYNASHNCHSTYA